MNRKTYKWAQAFTLIELLIVVAIIAILAAIAVPNFLEAQVRSKVSRAKTDMRSVATAIEAYAVDASMYPLSGRSHLLTTPIGYITALPEDPFAPISQQDGGAGVLAATYGSWGDIPKIYLYHGPNTFDPNGTGVNNQLAQRFGVRWTLTCLGPDQGWIDDFNLDASQVSNPYLDANPPYDTTNGTRSRGNIERVGPGNSGDANYRLIWREIF